MTLSIRKCQFFIKRKVGEHSFFSVSHRSVFSVLSNPTHSEQGIFFVFLLKNVKINVIINSDEL